MSTTHIFLESHFADAPDGGQRSAEFVRGVRGESLELFKGALQTCERFIEGLRQKTKFVIRILYVDARSEAFGTNLLCPTSHPLYWAKCAFCEVVACETGQPERQGQPNQKTEHELPESVPHWNFAKSDSNKY